MNKLYIFKKIETPRLIIRPVQLGDEIQLNQAVKNSSVSLQKWMPWAKDTSIEATRDFVQRGVFAWDSCIIIDYPMVVIHKKDQKIIAASGYNDLSNINQSLYEIGYWCDINYQGKGYATEYANALARYAFDALKASKVVISMQIQNKKSIAVAERLHFSNEGTKERDPIDCISEQPEKSYIYAVNSTDNLPDLDYSWSSSDNEAKEPQVFYWAKNTLGITHDKAFATSKTIIKTPWSNVIEINTGAELVYLKQTPQDLFLEAEVINLLRDKCKVSTIPEIVTNNPDYHCFIMKKCGDLTLRDFFSGELNLNILAQGIDDYKRLQKATINIVADLITLGVPDWRLNKFPVIYDKLIHGDFLKENGLNSNQQSKLNNYSPRVKKLCDKLASYDIPECLNHSDFHDNNILYDKLTKTTAIIDLGETAINHPFFSMAALINDTKRRYKMATDSTALLQLKQACYSRWLESDNTAQAAIQIVELLLPVYLLFTQKRFLDAINLPYNVEDPISVKQYDKINNNLAWFIDNMENSNGKC